VTADCLALPGVSTTAHTQQPHEVAIHSTGAGLTAWTPIYSSPSLKGWATTPRGGLGPVCCAVGVDANPLADLPSGPPLWAGVRCCVVVVGADLLLVVRSCLRLDSILRGAFPASGAAPRLPLPPRISLRIHHHTTPENGKAPRALPSVVDHVPGWGKRQEPRGSRCPACCQ
jgi:hypothetical protein